MALVSCCSLRVMTWFWKLLELVTCAYRSEAAAIVVAEGAGGDGGGFAVPAATHDCQKSSTGTANTLRNNHS